MIGQDVAPYAVRKEQGRGRLYAEPEAPTRSPWQRDRDRVLHSAGFRTLQYKTQVFINHEGDFFRTRLTHSLEVAQIARSIARQLRLDEDLTEALALAHDLGHTPFGHAGEDALKQTMEGWGGFDHNTQSIRLVTLLEGRYNDFDGLNLTWETLEGLAKHNGPVKEPSPYLAEYDEKHHLALHSFASAEAQVAALSDDIAYHGHDLDDGLRAGLLHMEDIESLPLVGDALKRARAGAKATEKFDRERRIRHETVRQVINALASDLTDQTRRNLEALKPRSADDVRNAPYPVVSFSLAMRSANAAIREFLYAKMYRHWRVQRMTRKARLATVEIFDVLANEPALLPDGWRVRAMSCDEVTRRRIVADYIAGMTDRFAMEEHRRLTELSALG
ncbi:deoxyguanosinetriphosphate triphosphohydrolase [Neoasaia chiangmaiensis NBRC 101099]|uniref:Deoxyguanosinetriphosphate triphosphohydrolase-like protein n=1 Tax=Neoasaia chiangmaiensis TaxID=320497 RepID=A0A1U9KM47_9PROT|nr:deoxyguanosinetriphosphate triphosphohydrolase [Neoasaia chiangmaiensis]AQS86862.1 deoxyguanosinetriphosphate triphosphohydrolase [Neoasaia chiangmaiensis]GBR37420.1 deoxyguanosinetriphosphate triphosphohydrolase [Neoasaia chiangmaiensis NBRC 101099]GEN14943.1 deoxyguanosinetriphosphate triphosphohydrolase-like protein [Neoasaia chiangmaiensis]